MVAIIDYRYVVDARGTPCIDDFHRWDIVIWMVEFFFFFFCSFKVGERMFVAVFYSFWDAGGGLKRD